jgi:hypothetical protein
MPFFVYILQSEKHSRFYTGMSSDPEKRLFFHNQGLNRSTRLMIIVYHTIPYYTVSVIYSSLNLVFTFETMLTEPLPLQLSGSQIPADSG